jgi:hypothetical protein
MKKRRNRKILLNITTVRKSIYKTMIWFSKRKRVDRKRKVIKLKMREKRKMKKVRKKSIRSNQNKS